ncbi:MAG: PilN domain-containing protein, partial [Candidatus Acidiferrales bacterium]
GNTLEIAGEAGSINAVANFITQLKRSGYFDQIEIKEAKEDDVAKAVTTYGFTMSAAIAPQASQPTQPQAKPAASAASPQPAPKGRS